MCKYFFRDEYLEAEKASQRVIEGKQEKYDIPDDIFRSTFSGFGLPFKIIKYSPAYSIVYDLNWVVDGTVGEHRDIAAGILPIEVLSKNNYDYRRNALTIEVENYLKNSALYQSSYIIIKNAISLGKSHDFLPSNILFLTGIEGVIRKLFSFILTQQQPQLTEDQVSSICYEKYNSLESLIMNCDLMDDYYLLLHEGYVMADYIDDPSLEKLVITYEAHKREADKFRAIRLEFLKAIDSIDNKHDSDVLLDILNKTSEKMSLIDRDKIVDDMTTQKFPVSIRVKLHYLVRRLKDIRNEVVHGKYDRFTTLHSNYLAHAALYNLIETLKYYDSHYSMENINAQNIAPTPLS